MDDCKVHVELQSDFGPSVGVRAKTIASGGAAASLSPLAGRTVREWGIPWLDRREREGIRSIRDDRSRWQTHVLDFAEWADWPPAAVTKARAREWLAALCGRTSSNPAHRRTKRPLASQTLKNVLNLVRRSFADMFEVGLIDENPFAGLKVHRSRGASTKRKWTVLRCEGGPTADNEQTRALAAMPVPERYMVGVAMGSGLRQGEQWNLLLADIVTEGPRPHLIARFGSTDEDEDEEAGPTKGGQPREVPLFGLALTSMRAWLAALPSFAPDNPQGLAFPSRVGTVRLCGKTFRAFEKLHEVVGRHVRWHDLRHTCASSLVGGWWAPPDNPNDPDFVWSLEEVRVLLGHCSISVTEKYAHFAADTAQRAAARMSQEPPAPVTAPELNDLPRRAVSLRRATVRRKLAREQSRRVQESEIGQEPDGRPPRGYGLILQGIAKAERRDRAIMDHIRRSGRVVYGSGFENRCHTPQGVETTAGVAKPDTLATELEDQLAAARERVTELDRQRAESMRFTGPGMAAAADRTEKRLEALETSRELARVYGGPVENVDVATSVHVTWDIAAQATCPHPVDRQIDIDPLTCGDCGKALRYGQPGMPLSPMLPVIVPTSEELGYAPKRDLFLPVTKTGNEGKEGSNVEKDSAGVRRVQEDVEAERDGEASPLGLSGVEGGGGGERSAGHLPRLRVVANDGARASHEGAELERLTPFQERDEARCQLEICLHVANGEPNWHEVIRGEGVAVAAVRSLRLALEAAKIRLVVKGSSEAPLAGQFRKRPIVVRAEQFHANVKPWPDGVVAHSAGETPHVRTLEGWMHVSEGDWIITGVKGEKYPCKPDIFAATYESVERGSGEATPVVVHGTIAERGETMVAVDFGTVNDPIWVPNDRIEQRGEAARPAASTACLFEGCDAQHAGEYALCPTHLGDLIDTANRRTAEASLEVESIWAVWDDGVGGIVDAFTDLGSAETYAGDHTARHNRKTRVTGPYHRTLGPREIESRRERARPSRIDAALDAIAKEYPGTSSMSDHGPNLNPLPVRDTWQGPASKDDVRAAPNASPTLIETIESEGPLLDELAKLDASPEAIRLSTAEGSPETDWHASYQAAHDELEASRSREQMLAFRLREATGLLSDLDRVGVRASLWLDREVKE